MKTLCFTVLLVVMNACSAASALDFGAVNVDARNVPLSAAIANPGKYAGQPVRVIGVFFKDYEGAFLFLSRESVEAYDTASAAVLPSRDSAYPARPEDLDRLHGRLVAVEGVLEASGEQVAFKTITRIFNKGSLTHVRPEK